MPRAWAVTWDEGTWCPGSGRSLVSQRAHEEPPRAGCDSGSQVSCDGYAFLVTDPRLDDQQPDIHH